MRKFKKAIALTLAMVMTASLTACGGSNNASTDPTKAPTTAPEKTDPTDAAKTDAPEATVAATQETSNVPEVNDEKIYIYGWNQDVNNNVLKYFLEDYPQYKDLIVFVDTGGSNQYQENIDPLLEDSSNEQHPDIWAMEMDYIMKYTDSDLTMDLSELGITSDDTKDMYQYTVDAATVDGKLKGISWQAAPGAIFYRRDMAKEWFGTDDPEEVSKLFADWDTVIATGKTVLEKSGGQTKLFSGTDDVKRVYQAGRTQAWYDDTDTIVIDPVMDQYLDFAKVLYDEGLTCNTTQWTDTNWTANMATDNVFAYCGCTWFLHWTIKANCGGEKVGEGTFGKWGLCKAPVDYYWGGTWLGVSKDAANPGLCSLVLKYLCNAENMEKICSGSLDYVNNKTAIANMVSKGLGAYEFLGGQDFLAYFSPLAEEIQLPAMCAEDFTITQTFDTQATEYATGNKTKEQAIEDFKNNVVDLYPFLKK